MTDLGRWLDDEVTPALFDRLDTAFPEFGWKKTGANWIATKWPGDFPCAAQHQNPERLVVYANRPYWIKLHGHEGVRLLDYVNGGAKPLGENFIKAIRELATRAGVGTSPLDHDLTPEQKKDVERRERRRSALDVVLSHTREVLWSDGGRIAREYLQTRGLTDDDIRELGLGLYLSSRDVESALRAAKIDPEAVSDSALVWSKIEGYIVVPWHDARGFPLTIYGRWHEKEPPQGKPKTIALPGEGTKASPLFFDRVRRAGHTAIVLVEGLFDAAMLQLRGETRACATVAAQLSGLQVETLARYKIERIFICGDPDGGGDAGTIRNIECADRIGAESFVVPRLPDGVDPDDFVTAEGVSAFKTRVAASVPGRVFLAMQALIGVTPDSGEPAKRAALTAVADIVVKSGALDHAAIERLTATKLGYSVATVRASFARPSPEQPRAKSEKPREEPKSKSKRKAASNGASPTEQAPPVDWEAFKLTTITTDPPRHELVGPAGEVIRLSTAELLSPMKFTAKFLDGTGHLPPLPEKKRGEYMREVATLLFEKRTIVEAAAEAGARGTLIADIKSVLRGSPQTDEPADMAQGALLLCRDGMRAFNARVLLERVRRLSPSGLEPADFYEGMRTLGAIQKTPLRHGTWRNRAWLIPQGELEEALPDVSDDEDQGAEDAAAEHPPSPLGFAWGQVNGSATANAERGGKP